jgi:hydrogenase expression/formation protein HypE
MKLPSGKIPATLLKEVIFKNLGAERKEVAVGPSAGIDGAVIDIGEKSLIVSMDPITGAVEQIGYLAVNVNANDVATFGVEPTFLFSCIMLPESAEKKLVETISVQMSTTAKDIGIAIVGGHCETTPGLTKPIVVGCTMGLTQKGHYITAGGAKPGDQIILTKSAGIEGTAILATDREKALKRTVSTKKLQNAKNFYRQISVVKDAMTAYKTGGVHAMHDPTEGGVAGGIHEMANASNLGVKVIKEKISVQPETIDICKHFQIDPLQLIGSGALLISVEAKSANRIVRNLALERIQASVIGEFIEDTKQRVLVQKEGNVKALPQPVTDHLWIALKDENALTL